MTYETPENLFYIGWEDCECVKWGIKSHIGYLLCEIELFK